jgi:hypothetical protein
VEAKEFIQIEIERDTHLKAHIERMDAVQQLEVIGLIERYASKLHQPIISDSNLKSLIEQYFEENLVGKFGDEDSEFVKEIIRDFVKNYYH